jgi:hypothetical protein
MVLSPASVMLVGFFYWLCTNHSELCRPAKLRCWGTGWESTWKLLVKLKSIVSGTIWNQRVY